MHVALEENSHFNDVNMLDASTSEATKDSRNEAGKLSKQKAQTLLNAYLTIVYLEGPSCSSSMNIQTEDLIFNVHFNNAVYQINISNLKTISKLKIIVSK